MPFKIRTATPADMEAIAALERLSETSAHWSEEKYRSLFASGAPRRLVLVIADLERIAGFAVARIVGEEWELENIAVDASLRRKGIASSLLSELRARAQAEGAERILLEVRESNCAARALYEKASFTRSASRKSYYRDPREDAICYLLELRSSNKSE
jgi:ribosomal-protein-alanine acetyltransferase